MIRRNTSIDDRRFRVLEQYEAKGKFLLRRRARNRRDFAVVNRRRKLKKI